MSKNAGQGVAKVKRAEKGNEIPCLLAEKIMSGMEVMLSGDEFDR